MDQFSDYKGRLAHAMRLANLDANALADELDVSYQAIKKVLAGTSKAFTAENNFKAARALAVDAEWLACGVGSPRSVAAWPVTAELQDAWRSAGPDQRRMSENAARNVLGLDALPRIAEPAAASRKRQANGE